MDTNLQPSSRVIFLYSLPKSVVEPMQLKGGDYKSVIKMIGDFDGVSVFDLNRDFFSMPHKCNILIILGEFLEDKNALLLQDDSILPITDLVNLVGSSFREVNVIDCAWCHSGEGKTHDKLKKLTNALVNTINGYTAAETRLAIYWLLLKDNTLLERNNYKESYDKILSDLDTYQNGMDPKQLASLSEGTNLGTMASGESPFEVKRNSKFFVRVIFHDDSDEDTIEHNIEHANNICHKIKRSVSNIKDGDNIHLDLCFDTYYPEMKKYLIGEGSYGPFPYEKDADNKFGIRCFVEAGFEENTIDGTLTIKINNIIVDQWDFMIWVTPRINKYMNGSLSNGNNIEHFDNRKGKFFRVIIPKQPSKPKELESTTKTKDFSLYVKRSEYADAVIKKLREELKNRTKPQDIMRCIRAAIDAKAIERPHYKDFCAEFGNIITKSSYNNYLNGSYTNYNNISEESYEPLKNEFESLIKE